jgi:hypothetical protein
MGRRSQPRERLPADATDEKTPYELQHDKRVAELAKNLGPVTEAALAL